MQTISFWQSAPAVATLVVGLGAAYVAARNTKQTLQHQRQEAQLTLEYQRQMAVDERVFEPRASAYIEAIKLLHDMIRAWDSGKLRTREGLEEFDRTYDYEPPGDLLARISTYGSPDAADVFKSGYRSAFDTTLTMNWWCSFQELEDTDHERVEELFTEASQSAARAHASYERLRELAGRDLQHP
jgi:hypothetical protein